MLSNENRLLAYSTHIKLSAFANQDIERLIQLPLNWAEIVAAASWYGIDPLLYRCLRDNPAMQQVPQEVMRQLKRAYDDTAIRNMYIYATLSRILPLFTQQGIKCIVLKGAMLADTVYDDIGLRPMQDIDLLFNRRDLPHAIALLSDLGYDHEGSKSPQLYLQDHYHITYTHPDTDIPIELHWHIAHDRHPPRLRLTDNDLIEQWIARAQPVTLSQAGGWMLCPADLIFHLCLHFLKHRIPVNGAVFATSAALLQLADIVRVIDHFDDRIDWNDLDQQASRYQINDLIHTTIKLATEISLDQEHGDNKSFKGLDGGNRYNRLMFKYLIRHDDMQHPLPYALRTPVNLRSMRDVLRGVIKWLLPDRPDLARSYNVPATARRVYVYYLLNPLNLIFTIQLFIRQLPRLRREIRLNRWIGG